MIPQSSSHSDNAFPLNTYPRKTHRCGSTCWFQHTSSVSLDESRTPFPCKTHCICKFIPYSSLGQAFRAYFTVLNTFILGLTRIFFRHFSFRKFLKRGWLDLIIKKGLKRCQFLLLVSSWVNVRVLIYTSGLELLELSEIEVLMLLFRWF